MPLFRCRNLDRNYFKRWLLREKPEEKIDFKLLSTFKRINTESAMRIHNTSKGLVAAPSTLPTSSSPEDNSRSTKRRVNISELLATKFVHGLIQLIIRNFCFVFF